LEPDRCKDITIEEVAVSENEIEEKQLEAVKSLESLKHRRFGSEEVEDEFFSTAREVAAADENATDDRIIEDSQDSDDEAPDAVGIQEAAMSVKSKDRDAAKAVKE
jgi:hypothetical protein